MIQFISENLSTILITAALAAVVALIIVKMIKDKKKGKTSCSCSCTGCAGASICHPDSNKK